MNIYNKYWCPYLLMNLIHVNQYCPYPRERKEPLYLKLREAKMTKTSTDKKISVIFMRLPKRLASSNDFLNTSN